MGISVNTNVLTPGVCIPYWACDVSIFDIEQPIGATKDVGWNGNSGCGFLTCEVAFCEEGVSKNNQQDYQDRVTDDTDDTKDNEFTSVHLLLLSLEYSDNLIFEYS